MKKILAVLGAMVLSASVGMYFSFSYTEKTLRNNEYIRDNVSETIAIVSLDDGVYDNGTITYYSNVFIDLLGNDSGYVVESAGGAAAGLADGKYGAIITFPSNTSECIQSLNSAAPVSLPISYTINPKLDSQSYINVASKIGDFQDDINDQVSYMYVSSILSELHGAQDQTGELLANNEEILDLLENLELMDYVENLDLGGIPELNFQPEGLNIEGYMNEANRMANDISGYYLASYQLAQRDYNAMNQALNVSSENLRSNAAAYYDQLNSWRDASNEQNRRISNYSALLERYFTDLSGVRTDLLNEVTRFNRTVGDFNEWYTSTNEWYNDLNAYNLQCLNGGNTMAAAASSASNYSANLETECTANMNAIAGYAAELEEYYPDRVEELITCIGAYNQALDEFNTSLVAFTNYASNPSSCIEIQVNNNTNPDPGTSIGQNNVNDNNAVPVVDNGANSNGEQNTVDDPTLVDGNVDNIANGGNGENSNDGQNTVDDPALVDGNANNTATSAPADTGDNNAAAIVDNNVPAEPSVSFSTEYYTLLNDLNNKAAALNTARSNLQAAVDAFNAASAPTAPTLSFTNTENLCNSAEALNSSWNTYRGLYTQGAPIVTNPYQAAGSEYSIGLSVPAMPSVDTEYELQEVPLMNSSITADMDAFLAVSASYDPMHYLSTDVDALIIARLARFSDYSYGIENMMNMAYERNINNMRSTLGTYTNYVNSMRNNAINTYNEEQDAFQASVTSYADGVRAINEENAVLIGSFSTVMPNSRSGSDVNTNVVNAIIQPVVFDNQSELMTAEVTSFSKVTDPLKYVMVGSGILVALFSIWSVVDEVRKRRA